MFKKLNVSFLKQQLAKAGIEEQVEAYHVLESTKRLLQEMFGEGVEQHATPVYVKQRALTIEIAHPAIAQFIREHEREILEKLFQRTGQKIYRVHFLLPRARVNPTDD